MTTLLRCERVERRHPQEKCASKCVRGSFLSAFIYFLTQKQSGVVSLQSTVISTDSLRLMTRDC